MSCAPTRYQSNASLRDTNAHVLPSRSVDSDIELDTAAHSALTLPSPSKFPATRQTIDHPKVLSIRHTRLTASHKTSPPVTSSASQDLPLQSRLVSLGNDVNMDSIRTIPLGPSDMPAQDRTAQRHTHLTTPVVLDQVEQCAHQPRRQSVGCSTWVALSTSANFR